MKTKLTFLSMLCLIAIATALTAGAPEPGWRTLLTRRLPELGHRNWIVIADSAYPSQVAPGIETIINTGARAAVGTLGCLDSDPIDAALFLAGRLPDLSATVGRLDTQAWLPKRLPRSWSEAGYPQHAGLGAMLRECQTRA